MGMELGVYRAILDSFQQRVEQISELLLETFHNQPVISHDVVLWAEWRAGMPGSDGVIWAHLKRCKWCETTREIEGLPVLPCACAEEWNGDRYILNFPAQYLSLSDTDLIRQELLRQRAAPLCVSDLQELTMEHWAGGEERV